jgi:hypothetical protein
MKKAYLDVKMTGSHLYLLYADDIELHNSMHRIYSLHFSIVVVSTTALVHFN